MADRIKLLPDVVANQIAAGEVVNRPSSVVKEMMENAIDAGAHTVTVNARDGGRELIQIVDDGCGMSPMDARMAFDRHATSKIASVEDIYALHTFGFRGEALASIAAVAQVELRTRQEGDEVGTQTSVNGGKFQSQEPVMCPAGSQFYVRNLFYNVPARRRFLEKSTASSKQIKTEFQRVALCNPAVAFELYDNDVPVYRLQPTSLAGRIVDVVGRHIKPNLLEVAADTSIVRVDGFVGRPAAAKKSNAEQYFFVNGRYFSDQYLRKAVLKAYEKLIPDTCFPSYFLFLTIDPERIDVNVHPQKIEVKFDDKEAVWEIIHAAVRNTLGKTGAVPMMDFTAEGRIEIPVARQGAVYDEPAAMVNEHYNPFAEGYVAEGADEQCGDVEEFPGEDFTEFPGPTPRGGRPAAGGDVGASRRGAAPPPAVDPVGGYILSPRGGGYDEVPSSAVAPDDAAVPFAGMADVPSSLGGGAVVAEDDAQRSVLEYVSSEDAAVQQRLIETPAAALTADLLAQEADFFSIGTNDLTGYTMAADRGNANVAYLYTPLSPAVLRAIRGSIAAAKAAGIPAGMCGEAAADPRLIPLLLSFGLEEFSVSPNAVLETRRQIARWSKADADAIAAEVMAQETTQDVQAALARLMEV